MRCNNARIGTLYVWFVLVAWFFACSPARAQKCDGDDQLGHVVRSIEVKARWLPEIALPLKRGDQLTPDKLEETRNAVRRAINVEKEKFNSEFVKLGRLQLVEVNFIPSCVRVVAAATCTSEGLGDKCVDIEMRPLALSTDPVFMASVLLPIPRSNQQTSLGNVPKLLRIFDPKFGMGSDTETGLTPEFEISTDLLSVGEVSKGNPAKLRPVSLLLKATGRKSLSEAFYTSEVKLTVALNQPTHHVESLAFETSFAADHQPQLGGSFLRNSLRFGGHVALNPAIGILNRVVLSGGYRRSRDRMYNPPELTLLRSENSFEGRAVLEGRIFDGFSRGALWVDGAKPSVSTNSYKRVAALFGYEKEIPVGEHTVGFEALFGAAKASRHTPEYSLFYGGSALSDFIYEDITDPETLSYLPTGPVLRSFGRKQAGFRTTNGQTVGANSFQHFNLTIAIPVPGLSAPLIPDEVVIDEPRTTLRDLVEEFSVNSGQNALSLSLQDGGLSEEEADKKAARVFGEIKPGLRYLARYAKIYSIKPMVMFDQARMSRVGNSAQSRYSIGGGIQFTVVVARFQAGYLHATKHFEGESRGNFLLRLVFTNLF